LDLAVDTIVKKAAVKYPVAITVTEANADTRNKAAQLGVSSGKFTVFQKANKPNKPILKADIREANIQDLQKKMTASSKDIKVIPHPRQMDTPAADHQDKRNKHTQPVSSEYHIKKEMNRKPQINKPKHQGNERSSSAKQKIERYENAVHQENNQGFDRKIKQTSPENRRDQREQYRQNQRYNNGSHKNNHHNNGKHDNRDHKNGDHGNRNH
jgi:hypothetical protein